MTRKLGVAGTLLGSFLVLALGGAEARAVVKVGDKPELQFEAAGGGNVSLAALRGRIVVVDFWATWCGPCMAEAEHMVALNAKYGKQGVQIIGISLDQDKTKMLKVASEKGFVWPQYFDGLVWKNKVGLDWGVHGIPQTFILSPEGEVLWAGHPAQLDAPLAKAIEEHPPQLVDEKTLAAYGKLLDESDAARQAGKVADAIKALAKVPPEAKLDKKLAERIEAARKELDAAAGKMVEEADAAAAAKNYVEAAAKLQEISKMSGTPAAKSASDKLAAMMATPEAKAAIAAAETARTEAARGAKADEGLAAARKLQADGKDESAYGEFKRIAGAFSGTASGDAAKEQVKKYEADAAFMKRMKDAASEGKAKAALSMAANYRSAGKIDLARAKYQSVIDQFPDTAWAQAAARELKALPAE